MKQIKRKTLALGRETIGRLTESWLAGAVGGQIGAQSQVCNRRGTGPVDSCEDCTGGVGA
jgi:hypothetical protein